jgi:RNA polymerase sigma-70 factor, ECF subfamily
VLGAHPQRRPPGRILDLECVHVRRNLQQIPVATQQRTQVTNLLLDWRRGDAAALERLVPLVYDELRRVARAHLRREPSGQTLQTTALVHEVYLRLVDLHELTLHDRTHFFAVSARLMRQILVDHARRKRADKRGGAVAAVSLADLPVGAEPASVDILALDEALDKLRTFDRRQCEVVELRFFAGLTVEEVAEALAISRATVERRVGHGESMAL